MTEIVLKSGSRITEREAMRFIDNPVARINYSEANSVKINFNCIFYFVSFRFVLSDNFL